MAISSTSSSTSATTTSSLDVASIVSQLMTAENKPIDVIKNKISTQQVFISDMGTIKSDVAALQDALGVFEDVNSYGNLLASTTDSSVVTATASSSASVGVHRVVVSKGAQNTSYNITGFSTNKDLINIDPINGFIITIGNTSYSSNGTKTIGTVVASNVIAKIGKTGQDSNNQAASTVADLQAWINGLGIKVTATLAQQNSSNWALQVSGIDQGANNDFSLSGLIGGKAFGGFRTSNADIVLDPVTGFQINVGGHVYSTLGTVDGSSSGSPPSALSSTTNISALAGWVNTLQVGITASVTGGSGSYTLELNPANGVTMSASGLPGAYVTGISGRNTIVSLDEANGFQVSVGGTTYKTAGAGAIEITGTGAGGGVTVSDLASWINGLSGANLTASVVGSGSNFALEVSNTNPLNNPAIILAGINSGAGQNITELGGFASAANILSLDSNNGFQLTIDSNTYKTVDGGSNVNGNILPTLAATGIGSTSTLDNLRTWINEVSTTYALGLTASISNSGAPYSLSIASSGALPVAGLNSNTIISGFNSAKEGVNLAQGGFTLTVGNHSFNSNGVLGSDATLTSLNNWINSVASSYVTSSIAGSNNTYDLVIGAKNNTDAISITGLTSVSTVTAVAIKGFAADSDPVSIDAVHGLQLSIGDAIYSTKTASTTLATSYSSGGVNIASLSNLRKWINDLASDNSLNISASITTAGDGSKQLEITQTNGSTLPISTLGINPSVYETGFNSSSTNIQLDAINGFQLKVGSTTYSTTGLGNASHLSSSTNINDLKGWINNLGGGALVKADYIVNDNNTSDYRLMVSSLGGSEVSIPIGIINSVNVTTSSNLSAAASSSAPIGTYDISITQTATAKQFTYVGPTNIVTLDPTNGFSLTFAGTTYKTTQGGTVVNNQTVPTLAETGIGSVSTLDDLRGWIESLSSRFNLGISASVASAVSGDSLTITGATGQANNFDIGGLLAPPTLISGFSSLNAPIAINSSGFSLTVGTHTFNSNGVLGSNTTLTSLNSWINSVAGSYVKSSIEGSNGSYKLKILQTGLPSTLSVDGLVPDVVDMGFPAIDATVNLDLVSGFSISMGGQNYSTKDIGRQITGTGFNRGITATDLKNWINALVDNQSNRIFTAELLGSGNNYALKVTNFNTGSADDIAVSGVTNAIISSDKNILFATASDTVNAGTYAVNIKQNAAATIFNVAGFANENAVVDVNNMYMIVGTNVYYANGDKIAGATIGYDINLINTVSNGVSHQAAVTNLIGQSATNNGLVTIRQLSNWINGLHDNVHSEIQSTSNGGSQLHVNGTLTGASHAVAMAYLGNTYIGGELATATVSGYSNANSLIALDINNGFELTIQSTSGTTVYSTKDPAFNSYLSHSFSDESANQFYSLSDLCSWINNSDVAGNVVNASIDGNGTLRISAVDFSVSNINTSGLNSVATINLQNYTDLNSIVSLDTDNGFQVTVNSTPYSYYGNLPHSTTTLGELRDWINAIDPTNVQASIINSNSNYSLAIYETHSTGSEVITAKGVAYSQGGFGNYADKVDPSSYWITVNGSTYFASDTSWIWNNQYGLVSVDPIMQTGIDASGQIYSTLNDLNNWFHALRDGGLSIGSSITGDPTQLSLNVWGTDGTVPVSFMPLNVAYDEISNSQLFVSSSQYDAVSSSSASLVSSSQSGGNLGVTSIAQNGGITLQGHGPTTAFILKGTDSNYVLVDDPRNIVYDGNAVFWQGPADYVDPNYVNDTSRGQRFANDPNTWIGQPGVVLNQAGGQLIPVNTQYTGTLQSDGTVTLNYPHNSPMNNVTIARNAKGTLDGTFFSSESNNINNVNQSGINLNLVKSVSPYDPAENANVIVGEPAGYSNTPNTSTDGVATISQSANPVNTLVTLITNDDQNHPYHYSQSNLEPITLNGVTYTYTGTVSSGGSPITARVQVLGPTTVSDLAIVDSTSATQSLTNKSSHVISSNSSGASGAVTAVSANNSSNFILDGGITKFTSAQDAELTIDGLNIVRSSNTINDVVTGVTFQIMANPSPRTSKSADVKVELGADNTEKMITDLADAYNKLIKHYNSMTGNANNGRAGNGKAGTFGSSPTTLSFVETVKRKFATGATYNIGTNDANGNPYIMSLAALGLDYQLDGTLKYNSIEYLTSQANGLREKFLKGLRIGYVSPVDNLMTFIKAQSGPSGALAQEMAMENNSINALNKEQENLQTRLNKIQDNYIAQYSGLNALLFQLNSTSSNLGNALSALTNMAAGK